LIFDNEKLPEDPMIAGDFSRMSPSGSIYGFRGGFVAGIDRIFRKWDSA